MYNIYYRNKKINNLPLSEEDIRNLLSQKIVKKYDRHRHTIDEISTDELVIHKSIKIR